MKQRPRCLVQALYFDAGVGGGELPVGLRPPAIVLRACRLSVIISLRSSITSALYRPCLVLAAFIRVRPSIVRGPVDMPPCILHLPFGIAGPRHGLPLRVRALQRGQDCANVRCVRQLVECMGLVSLFASSPSPGGWCFNVSDNGFSSWMDMNVFDADNLLTALSAFTVEC